MRLLSSLLLAFPLLLCSDLVLAKELNQCAIEAPKQAAKLLKFQVGEDDRIDVGQTAKRLPDINNPANGSQKVQVYEIWGRIYKGSYRMRLIYWANSSDCILMCQEILEYAKL
jgi:hypothetical protein